MKNQTRTILFVGLLAMFLLAAMFGCSEDNGNSPTDNNGTSGLPPDPGVGNLAGKVIGTVGRGALSGVQVAVGSNSTISGGDGTFRLNGVGSGTLGVVISGANIYTRTAAVDTNSARSVQLDAIETNQNFHLTFYRELARGNHPNEGDMYPTHRWTNSSPPTFYINTNAAAALDGEINQSTIDAVKDVVRQIVPIFSGNYYSSFRIETRYFATINSFSDIPDNSMVISFDDTLLDIGAYGFTSTNPDFVSSVGSSINKAVVFVLDSEQYYKSGANPSSIAFSEIIAHELGHGFGYRHASALPSIMYPADEYGGLYSTFDQMHMAVMYSRPIGNTDIDNDPLPNTKTLGQPIGPQVFLDSRANVTKSPELQEQLERLQRFGMIREYVGRARK